MQSDYFTPMNEIEKEANLFINQRSAIDAVYYYTKTKLSDLLAKADDKQTECIITMQDLEDYKNHLLKELKDYELYELCAKVKERYDVFHEELNHIFESLVREELIEMGLTAEEAEKALIARRTEDWDTVEYYNDLIEEKSNKN